MLHDLERRLNETAYEPVSPLHLDVVERRGLRRRAASASAGVVVAAMLLVGLSSGLARLANAPTPVISEILPTEPDMEVSSTRDDGVVGQGNELEVGSLRQPDLRAAPGDGALGQSEGSQAPTGAMVGPGGPGLPPVARFTFDESDDGWWDRSATPDGGALGFGPARAGAEAGWSWTRERGAWSLRRSGAVCVDGWGVRCPEADGHSVIESPLIGVSPDHWDWRIDLLLGDVGQAAVEHVVTIRLELSGGWSPWTVVGVWGARDLATSRMLSADWETPGVREEVQLRLVIEYEDGDDPEPGEELELWLDEVVVWGDPTEN